ncbi:MAG: twin-arginine translocase subunit TatC [Planctomycetes bacterium]|nr:twin-arginine translocase subunit TatC [Planctomycetota bacterium]
MAVAEPETEPGLQAHRMSFGEHLEELRQRLIYSCIGIGVAVGICLFWQQELLFAVTWPHRSAHESIGQSPKLEVFDYADRFMIPMKVALIFGLALAAPVVLWQMWKFLAAGLKKSEKKYVLVCAPASLVLFFSGAIFGYLVLIPVTLKFLGSFGQDWNIYEDHIALDKYLDMFFGLTIAAGAIFEIPLVMAFLSFIGLVPPKTFASWRKMEILVAAILGAVLTPGGDLVSMASLSVPIIVLYEVGILAGRLVYRKPAETEPVAPAEE